MDDELGRIGGLEKEFVAGFKWGRLIGGGLRDLKIAKRWKVEVIGRFQAEIL